MTNYSKSISAFCLLLLVSVGLWLTYPFYTSPVNKSPILVAPAAGSFLSTQKKISNSKDSSDTTNGEKTDSEQNIEVTDELRSLRQQLKSQLEANARLRDEIKYFRSLLADQDIQNGFEDDNPFNNETQSDERMGFEHERELKRADLFDEALARESSDPDSAKLLTDKANRLLETAKLDGSEMSDVICGETLCRIELKNQDEDALRSLLNYAPMLLELSAESFTWVDEYEDGSSIAAFYLSKDGFSLPGTDQWAFLNSH